MPEPIAFQVVQNLQTALRAMAVASGYHYTVQSIAVKLDPNHAVEAIDAPDGPRPLALIEIDLQAFQYFPASQLKSTLPATIHWVSDSTPTDDTSRMQTFFRGCADVERAITQDITRGGLAVDTRIVKQEFDTAVQGAQVWAKVGIEIGVHRTYGEPDA